jgi:hypothetical protein
MPMVNDSIADCTYSMYIYNSLKLVTKVRLFECFTLASFHAGLFDVVLDVRASVILPVLVDVPAPAKSSLSHAFEPLAAVCSPSGILLPRQPSSAYS